MKYRTLGKNGPTVSAIGLGCMGMSEFYGETDQQAAFKTIETAYKDGVTLFDTADMYGNGQNEELIGQALKSFPRDKIIIATKCGIERGTDSFKINSSGGYIRQACEASLKRLRVKYIDIYYLHRHNPEISIEEPMQTMLDLIKEGKIRYIGLSEVDVKTIRRAHQVVGDKLVAVQTEYSIVNRAAAEAILPTCRELGIAFVPYSPIARGFLSGKIKDPKIFTASKEYDFRSSLPQFQQENFKANLKLVTAIENIAGEKGCTPAQLSLAWLLAQGEDIVPIPGTKRPQYVLENDQATQITLSVSDLKKLTKAYQENPVQGARLPEELMKVFNLSE